jgi:hypothetical protein
MVPSTKIDTSTLTRTANGYLGFVADTFVLPFFDNVFIPPRLCHNVKVLFQTSYSIFVAIAFIKYQVGGIGVSVTEAGGTAGAVAFLLLLIIGIPRTRNLLAMFKPGTEFEMMALIIILTIGNDREKGSNTNSGDHLGGQSSRDTVGGTFVFLLNHR